MITSPEQAPSIELWGSKIVYTREANKSWTRLCIFDREDNLVAKLLVFDDQFQHKGVPVHEIKPELPKSK